MIDTVYKITKRGLMVLYGEDAEEYIHKIRGIDDTKDDSDYIFFDHGHEIYLLCEASEIKPLTFPAPQDYGTTSQQLFAMAVTYATTMARLLLKRLRTPLTLMGQIRKGATVILPIVIVVIIIFLVAVMTTG